MIWPLRILAIPSVLAGLWGIEYYLARAFSGTPHAAPGSWYELLLAPFSHSPLAAVFGLLATMAGFGFAWRLYSNTRTDPLPQMFGSISRALRNRLYFDELYTWVIRYSHELLANAAQWMDRWLVAGVGVRGTHGAIELLGRALRLVQTGNLQTYAFLLVVGTAAVLYFVLR